MHVTTPISARPQLSTEGETRKISRLRVLLRGAVGAAAVASLAVGLAGTAFAAPVTDDGSVNVSVGVASALTLSGLTPSFPLNGIPGATVNGPLAVTYNVATNNIAGYSVTVQSAAANMIGTGSNGEVIPIGALSVREGNAGATTYTPLSSTAAVQVHTQATHSAAGGDNLANDYQVVIPFVNSDTYSATLNYVATTL